MNSRYFGLLLILTVAITGHVTNAQSSSNLNWRDAEPGTVTLFPRATNNDYGKAAFSFKHNLRSDAGKKITRNNYELLYGGISLNRDTDWFSVTMVTDDCSRIQDLGKLDWSQIVDIPYLAASAGPPRGIRMPSKTETFEDSSRGQVTRAAAGHMYLVHSRDSDSDFYTLFRVENLVPNNEVTISWKAVPSPEWFPRTPCERPR